MLTAMLAVKNVLGGNHDLWNVNMAQDYHEELEVEIEQSPDGASTEPCVPERSRRAGSLRFLKPCLRQNPTLLSGRTNGTSCARLFV